MLDTALFRGSIRRKQLHFDIVIWLFRIEMYSSLLILVTLTKVAEHSEKAK